jgi:hypothetical protein
MEAADPGRRGRASTSVRRLVRAARPATAAEWQAAWRSNSYATYFQSPARDLLLDRLLKAREEGPVAYA